MHSVSAQGFQKRLLGGLIDLRLKLFLILVVPLLQLSLHLIGFKKLFSALQKLVSLTRCVEQREKDTVYIDKQKYYLSEIDRLLGVLQKIIDHYKLLID